MLVCCRRGYATFARAPMRYPLRKNQAPDALRVYTPRKSHLYSEYLRLTVDNPLILLLSPTNFSASHLMKLRREIVATAIPPRAAVDQTPRAKPDLTVVRVQLLGAALREHPTLKPSRIFLSKMVNGPLAMLTLPSLDPVQLTSILRVLDRTVKQYTSAAATAAVGGAKNKVDDLESPPPGGGGVGMQKPIAIPRLDLLGGIIEGRLLQVDRVREVSQLPNLDTLRAQIVGLISSPAAQIVGIMGEAAGGRLARTLEGFRQGLEEAAGSSEK